MDLTSLKNLVDYHYWANRRMMEVVDTLSPEQFTRNVVGGLSTIQATVAHLIGADEVFLAWFQGQPGPTQKPEAPPNPAAARERWSRVEARFRGFLGELSDGDVLRPITVHLRKAGPVQLPLWQVILQVINHGTHHRGQITTMLRQVGAVPVGTDLILYYLNRS